MGEGEKKEQINRYWSLPEYLLGPQNRKIIIMIHHGKDPSSFLSFPWRNSVSSTIRYSHVLLMKESRTIQALIMQILMSRLQSTHFFVLPKNKTTLCAIFHLTLTFSLTGCCCCWFYLYSITLHCMQVLIIFIVETHRAIQSVAVPFDAWRRESSRMEWWWWRCGGGVGGTII